jgi:hypothetical protein
MTRHFELNGGGKQGRFEEELTVLRRIYAKRPCFPPQSIKSNDVILSEAKDLIILDSANDHLIAVVHITGPVFIFELYFPVGY